jgi:hypothetical protein
MYILAYPAVHCRVFSEVDGRIVAILQVHLIGRIVPDKVRAAFLASRN